MIGLAKRRKKFKVGENGENMMTRQSILEQNSPIFEAGIFPKMRRRKNCWW